MKILSLFDGMACGHIAFNELGKCKERLREYLAKAVDIKEVAYGGTSIHWLDDKGENKGEKNDG